MRACNHRGASALRFVLPVLLAAPCAHAQDIETRAERVGRELPAAYYTRVQANPSFFALADGWRKRTNLAAAGVLTVEGALPIAVIPALFAGSAPPPAAVAAPVLQARLFDGSPSTTITGYYAEISLGKLTMKGRVGDWVPTSLTIAEVTGNSNGLGNDGRVGDWLRQAVAAADATFDFTQFDNDGPDGRPNSGDDDGRVDGAAFLFHEQDASCGGPGIWPHRSRVSNWGGGPATTKDIGVSGRAIVVDDYIVLGATQCNGTGPLESNVFAHEMGHVLGLPDYYDSSAGLLRQQRRWVVGCWEIMSAGSWGCGTGPQPASMLPPHMGAFPKSTMNWVAPVVVPPDVRNKTVVLRPVRVSGDALRINLSAREYLLLEYRDRNGFDVGLPASGVLVYHVELNRGFLPCATCQGTYSYALLEADANAGLTRPETAGGNRGEAGDAYRNGMAINSATTPSTVRNDGARTTVSIQNITVDAAANVARVTITTAALPVIAAAALPAARRYARFSADVGMSGGAPPYQVTLQGLPAGLEASSVADRLTIAGTPNVSGTFPVNVTMRDALGTTGQGTILLSVAPPFDFTSARLMAAIGDNGASLSADERGFLDEQGNRNGRIDVGDVRAYLRRVGK